MNHHKLTAGTSQIERLVRALSPDSFKLDDRTWQDFITTAHRYAAWLTYYDEFNQPDGDWAGFWEQETLTYLAVLAALDTDQIRRSYEEIEIELMGALEAYHNPDDNSCVTDPYPGYILRLIEQIRALARQIEQIYFKLYSLRHPLADTLLSFIEKDNKCDIEELTGALQRLIRFNKAADDTLRDCEYSMFYEVEAGRPDSRRWGIVGLPEYHRIIAAGALPSREALREIFKAFLQALVVLKSRAQTDFNKELALIAKPESEHFRVVQPHIALFIAFLHLFRYVQDDMNELPAKHLRYYYEQVLGIRPRAAQPDSAYLIFTLAKGIHDELLEKGTLLIGGKDKNGKPLYYETLDDWRITEAKVEEVLNTYVGKALIRAAKVVEKGAPLAAEPFRLFGDNADNPAGELGFAIASHQLLLREGKRDITIDLELNGPIRNANDFDLGAFSVRYTTEEGFQKLDTSAGDRTGFSIQPQITPFLPIQTVEPARRIVNDIVSEICMQTNVPSGTGATIAQIYSRTFGDNAFLNTNLFYPALSGIYFTSYFIIEERNKYEAITEDTDEKKEIASLLAELYFYRAYYHWALATTYAPAFSDSSDPDISIPDLRNLLPSSGGILTFSKLSNLFSAIELDLASANEALTPAGAPDNTSKTAINQHVVNFLLARVQFAKRDFDSCLATLENINKFIIDEVPLSGDAIGNPAAPFDAVLSSPEVIWALETAHFGARSSWFSYLGYNDSFGRESKKCYAMSGALNDVYKKDGGANDLRVTSLFHSINPDATPPAPFFSIKYFRNAQSMVVMFRYAEVLLMKAYCLSQQQTPDTQGIIDALNPLRRRAGVPEYVENATEGKITFPSGPNNISAAISGEFLREMAFEGVRLDWAKVVNEFITERGNSSNIQSFDPSAAFFTVPSFEPERIKINTPTTLLTITIHLQKDAPGLVPNPTLAEAGITRHPAVYVTFASKTTQSVSGFYNFLLQQTLDRATIAVDVEGIQQNLILQNDFGIFDGTQRFYPFGPVPESGARFFLGCAEAFNKKLSTAKIRIDWIDKSLNLLSVYTPVDDALSPYFGYPQFNFNPQIDILTLFKGEMTNPKEVPLTYYWYFKIPPKESLKFSNLRENVVEPEIAKSMQRFDTDRDLNIVVGFGRLKPVGQGMQSTIIIDGLLHQQGRFVNYNFLPKYEPTIERGFVQFTLKGSFGHKEYPNMLTAATIAMSKTRGPTGASYLPKPPYTPATTAIYLDYTSVQDMEWGTDQFLHLLPFNGIAKPIHAQQTGVATAPSPDLVYDFDLPAPQAFNRAASGAAFYPSTLYIGLSKLDPGGALSLLFQAAEGSEIAPDDEAPEVRWSYLRRDNDWEAFRPENILSDSTLGLTKSGIVRLAIPKDISSEGNTMLKADLLWVRASLRESEGKLAGALPAFTAIDAQAAEVRFSNQGNDTSHLAQPVPEESITRLAYSRAVIKSIAQPLPTFGGRLPEAIGTEFFRRVSERLRHKSRVVTPADYERLLLEGYAALHTAKTIPHTRYEKRAEITAPGCVTVAVIPNLRLRPAGRRVSPRMAKGELLRMEQYLRGKTNLHVAQATPLRRLQVLNPLYDRVGIKVKIKFIADDINLFKTRAEQALNRFISPWISDVNQVPAFGRCIYRSQIVALLERLPFVEYVQQLSIYVERTQADVYEEDNGYVIEPTTSRSILTTGQNHLVYSSDDQWSPTAKPLISSPLAELNTPEAGPPDNQLEEEDENVNGEQQSLKVGNNTSAFQYAIENKPPVNVEIKPAQEDDLTVIPGIGPKTEGVLKAAGIRTLNALAAETPENLKHILEGKIRIPSTLDTWPDSAAKLKPGL